MGAESREVRDSGDRLTFSRPYLSYSAQLNNFLNGFLYLPLQLQGG